MVSFEKQNKNKNKNKNKSKKKDCQRKVRFFAEKDFKHTSKTLLKNKI